MIYTTGFNEISQLFHSSCWWRYKADYMFEDCGLFSLIHPVLIQDYSTVTACTKDILLTHDFIDYSVSLMFVHIVLLPVVFFQYTITWSFKFIDCVDGHIWPWIHISQGDQWVKVHQHLISLRCLLTRNCFMLHC